MAVNLITDRTQADAIAFQAMRQAIIKRELADWTEWFGEQRGAYNIHTLNRVGMAVKEIAALISDVYSPVVVIPKTDWTIYSTPTPDQMRQYLFNIEAIRSSVSNAVAIPDTPDSMNRITVDTANDIERILMIARDFVLQISAIYLQSGNAWSGDNFYFLIMADATADKEATFLSSGNAWSGDNFYFVTEG